MYKIDCRRMNPIKRKQLLLIAAIKIAETKGYNKITKRQIAAKAHVSEGLVAAHFVFIKNVRTSVLKHAIKTKNYKIILQGISMSDPIVKRLPLTLKQEVLKKCYDEL